jgi:hypothetical protein
MLTDTVTFPLGARRFAVSVASTNDAGAGGELPEWPAMFTHPDGSCPPADAVDLDGEIFVLVASSPPTADDFRNAKERGVFPGVPHCLRVGLSCALAAAALVKRQKRVPRLKNHLIASAPLRPAHGKHKQTTDDLTHYTMWLRTVALQAAPGLFSVRQGAP